MKKLLGFVLVSAWLMGCSDETELSNFAAYSTGMLAAADSVESVYSLGECTADRDAEVIYVSKQDAYYICMEEDWVDVTDEKADLEAVRPVSNSDNSLSCEINTASSENFCFDVIVRDFQPSHSDFENFPEEAVNNMDAIYAYGLAGYGADWYGLSAYHNSCGNQASYLKYGVGVPLGKDGFPMVANPLLPSYLQQVSAYATLGESGILTYGECDISSIAGVVNQRGFGANAAAQFTGVQKNSCAGSMYWENMVVYSPGMVNPYLTFEQDDSGNPLYLEGAHIHKLGELCDNVNFAQWYEDVAGVNKRSNLTFVVPGVSDSTEYKEINYNYNNGGYFPLDVIDAASQMYTGPVAGSDQWGPQSFSIFCPPYAYKYATMQDDFMGQNTYGLCSAWNAAGGARALASSTAQTIANNFGTLGYQHLRNYHYTSVNFARFTYDAAGEGSFELGGNNDVWVFVDGVLVIDLGGTHQPIIGRVDLKTLAENNHGCHDGEPLAKFLQENNACGTDGKWTDGSVHYLHVFNANRQTEGATFYFRAKL